MKLGVTMALTDIVGISAIIIDDLFWELVSARHLAPLALGSLTTDRSDAWDLDDDEDPPDFTPAIASDIGSEGYWDIDGNSDIQPLDV